jgi:hypothetical protein
MVMILLASAMELAGTGVCEHLWSGLWLGIEE